MESKSCAAIAFNSLWSNGAFLMVCASILMATLTLSVKMAAFHVPVLQVVVVRGAAGFVITLITALATKVPSLTGRPENRPLILLRTILGSLAMTLGYYSAHLISLHEQSTLYFTGPAITAVAAWLMLGERMGGLAMLGVAFSIIGVPLITRPAFLFGDEVEWSHDRLMGISLALMAAFCCTGVFLVLRKIGTSESPLTITLWHHLFSCTSTLIPLLFGWPVSAVLP